MITGIYGPNDDNPKFYEDKIFQLIDEFDPQYCLFGGDFNLVLDQSKDTYNYLHNNNVRARTCVLEDLFTFRNPLTAVSPFKLGAMHTLSTFSGKPNRAAGSL